MNQDLKNNRNYVIAIGRQFGSGGREVGQRVAQLLDIDYFDKQLLLEASKASGINAEASIRNGAHIIYQDNNNSSEDFHERQKCSLRE